jgi:predicted amino acid dehydrogenase
MAQKFAFIAHPLTADEADRKLGIFYNNLPSSVVAKILSLMPPLKLYDITGVQSAYGSAEGCVLSSNLSPQQAACLSSQDLLDRMIKAGRLAVRLGARILGLAAPAGLHDAGVSIARKLNLAVTTGSSYSLALALKGVERAVSLMGIDRQEAEALVLGADTTLGSLCAQFLSRAGVGYLSLAAADQKNLDNLAQRILFDSGISCKVTSQINKAVRHADLVIAAAALPEIILLPEDFKPGAVICDLAGLRELTLKIAAARDDLLVIEGGAVAVPGAAYSGFTSGFPPGITEACLAETMILALERRYENYSLGRNLRMAKVEEIWRLGRKHGFMPAGFCCFDRFIPEARVEQIRQNARTRP